MQRFLLPVILSLLVGVCDTAREDETVSEVVNGTSVTVKIRHQTDNQSYSSNRVVNLHCI